MGEAGPVGVWAMVLLVVVGKGRAGNLALYTGCWNALDSRRLDTGNQGVLGDVRRPCECGIMTMKS